MIDPEIFINQKLLKPYSPTAEPMAVAFFVTRRLKKFDIKLILNREIQKAEQVFQEKAKQGITKDEIEEAKIHFAQPSNLFHCLWLKTIPGNLSFDKRLDFIIDLFKKLMSKYLSFYNREIIRENFINGVFETMILLRTSTFQSEVTSTEVITGPKGSYPFQNNKEELSFQDLFKDKTKYQPVINRMIELNVLDAMGKLKNGSGNKTKLNLLILQLANLKIIKTEGLSANDITRILKKDFGDSSNHQYYTALIANYNAQNLPVRNYRFLESIRNIGE